MENNVPLMDSDAQRLYVNSMLSNPDVFSLVNGILRPNYFDPDIGKGVKYMQQYFHENRSVPPMQVFMAATKLKAEDVNLPQQSDKTYIAEQIASFCRFQECISVIKKSMGKEGYFETGDLGTMVAEMTKATQIGLMTDIGIDYFADPIARLESYELEDPVISTGWTTIDEVIGGGIGLEELVLFLAPSGGGKSVSMLNLAFNLMVQGYDGVYISLEMRDMKVARRTDQIIGNCASQFIGPNKLSVAEAILKFKDMYGVDFFVKRMPEGRTNANDIIAYLRQLKSAGRLKKLGFVVVDYLDIMAPVQRGYGDSMFLKDKFVSEEIRAIGHDFKCIVISGSQLEKGATKLINDGEKMHQGNVQGGSSKTNTADLMIATVKTDAMHEAGEYRFEFPKARNSDAGTKQVTMSWNKKSLRISDMTGESQMMNFRPKRKQMEMAQPDPGAKRQGLADLSKRFGMSDK